MPKERRVRFNSNVNLNQNSRERIYSKSGKRYSLRRNYEIKNDPLKFENKSNLSSKFKGEIGHKIKSSLKGSSDTDEVSESTSSEIKNMGVDSASYTFNKVKNYYQKPKSSNNKTNSIYNSQTRKANRSNQYHKEFNQPPITESKDIKDTDRITSKQSKSIESKFKKKITYNFNGSLKQKSVNLGNVSLKSGKNGISSRYKPLKNNTANKMNFKNINQNAINKLKVDTSSDSPDEAVSGRIYNLSLDGGRYTSALRKRIPRKINFRHDYTRKPISNSRLTFERSTKYSNKVTDKATVNKTIQKNYVKKRYANRLRQNISQLSSKVKQAPQTLAKKSVQSIKTAILRMARAIQNAVTSTNTLLGIGGILLLILPILILMLLAFMLFSGVGSNAYAMNADQATEIDQMFTEKEMDYLEMLKDKASSAGNNATVSYDDVGHEPHELLALVNVLALEDMEESDESKISKDMAEDIVDEIFEARYQFGESSRKLENGDEVITLTSTTNSFDNLIYGTSSLGITVKTSEFIDKIGSIASKVADENGIYASVMIAQALLESGGGNLSELASPPYFNLFGIKGNYNGNTINLNTNEDDGSGNMYMINDGFRDYDSYEESMQDYASLLKNNYPGTSKNNTESYKNATEALTGTYATDTSYNTKLNDIIEQYDLTQFDDGEVSSSDNQDDDDEFDSAEETTSKKIEGDKPVNPLPQMPETSSGYDYRTNPVNGKSEFHNGMDYAVPSGTPILAVKNGTVEETGSSSSAGNYVYVKMEDGLSAGYYHLSAINVSIGDSVKAGDTLGKVGSTGMSTGPHLHFEISDQPWGNRVGGVNYNPAEYLQGAISVDGSASGASGLGLSKEQRDLYKQTVKLRGIVGSFESPIENYDWGNQVIENWGLIWNEDKLKTEESNALTISVKEKESVRSQVTGTVTRIGIGWRGQFVEVKGADTITVQYIGLENISVSRGQGVRKGDILGETDSEELSIKMRDSDSNKELNPQIMMYTENAEARMYSALGKTESNYNQGNNGNNSELNSKYAGKAYDDTAITSLFNVGKKYIGMPYVWGGYEPSTSFDCSGFIYWVYQEAGLAPDNWSRTTANEVYYQYTSPISESEAKPGDLVFFENTYSSNVRFTHIGIYAGDGVMLHAGDPITFASIKTDYWQQHNPTFARLNR
ncbi:peptidoglycan DD-metalloendopeptidase family protein [Aerococcus viridans]|uniref:peptidoglycan DD-metalloendopeptidase family protein n=1 Tax=Aerococcus viridans TaxID=1377 RepID=UPI003B224E5A